MQTRIKKHSPKPNSVGRSTESITIFLLLVSLKIVHSVVVHGQWNKKKMMVDSDNRQVQPFAIKISAMSASLSVLDEVKIITKIGSTNSLAGLPRMNASKIAPPVLKKMASGTLSTRRPTRLFLRVNGRLPILQM